MRLHLFNPEHELALAANIDRFTPPHAARQLGRDLAFLPMLWADDDDIVIVPDREAAQEAMKRLPLSFHGELMEPAAFKHSSHQPRIELCPWGWDKAVRTRFIKMGIPKEALPTDEELSFVHMAAHRHWAYRHLLSPLRQIEGTVGRMEHVAEMRQLEAVMKQWGRVVAKAPWSSSGRGVRYLNLNDNHTDPLSQLSQSELGWIENTFSHQNSLVVEPYYNKVMDFAMEFTLQKDRTVEFNGLSLFKTSHAAYTGNIIDTECEKRMRLYQLVDERLLNKVVEKLTQLITSELGDNYTGPLGVDAMVVRCTDNEGNSTLKIQPCVELNLRQTMGHLALALHKQKLQEPLLACIEKDDKYRLRLHPC